MSSISERLQKMKDSGPAVSSKVRTFTDTRTEAEKETAHEGARQRASEVMQEKYGGLNRVKNTLSGAAKGSGAGFTNALGTLTEGLNNVGAFFSEKEDQRLAAQDLSYLEQYRKELEDAQKNGDEQAAKIAQIKINQAEYRLKTSGEQTELYKDIGTQSAQSLYKTADELSASSAKDLSTAKTGLGTIGKAAVDIGAAGAQMLGDIAAGAATGGGALVPMAVRSFGSGAQEARQSGATLGQQLAYGAGSGALSVATEKISNVAAPFRKAFGSGVAEDLARKLVSRFGENVAVKTMSRLSQTTAGRLAASALGEGGEEMVENLVQPILQKATYDPEALQNYGNADYWADTLYQGIIGGALGLAGSGVEAGQNAVSRAVSNISARKSSPASTEAAGAPTEETAGQRTTRQETTAQIPTDPLAQVIAREAAKQTAAETEQTAAPAAEQTASPVQDPLLQALLGGKRVSQTEVSNQQFSQLADRGDISIDADGKVYQVSPESHIDQRTQETVSDKGLNAFQFDHPELQSYYKQAAEALIADADLSLQFPMSRRYERTMQGNKTIQAAQTFQALRTAMDETGLTRAELIDAAERIIQDKGQENVAAAKRVELILDQMLTNGWTPMAGETVAPNQDYIAAKQEITGYQEAAPAEELPIWDMPEATEGLGAANAGELGTFTQLQNESDTFHDINRQSAQREREIKGRAPEEVPVINPRTGQNIGKTVSTILNSPLTSNEMAVEIENAVADGKFDYIPVTDRAAVSASQKDIANRGLNAVAYDFIAKTDLGQRLTKQDISNAISAYNQAVENGNKTLAFELSIAISEAAHDTAQVLQAVNLMNRLTPEGKLLALRRFVDKMNANQKSSTKRAQSAETDMETARLNYVEQNTGFTISDELATNYLMAETEQELAAAWDAILTDLANQIPSTFRDKANFWRYTSMLLNPTTHIRNISGNLLYSFARKIKNGVGFALEKAVIKDQSQRTKAFLGSKDKALVDFASQQFDTDQKAAMGSGKYSDSSATGINREIQERRKTFSGTSTNPIARGIQSVGDFNSRFLDMEDLFFSKRAYVNSFASALKAKGITAEQAASGGPEVDAARAYAIEEAQKATYRNTTALSEVVSKIGRYEGNNPVAKAGSFAADALFPFRRTPANILTTGLDYSPIGLAKGIKEALVDVKSGKVTASDALDSLASGLTGTGIMALGAFLMSEGFLSANGGSDDRKEDFEQDTGKQKYALQIGDTTYTLDWALPVAMPLFAGAAVMESIESGGGTFDALADAMLNISNVVLETSMLSSLNDFINGWSYADNKVGYAATNVASSYFNQYVPTIGGKIASAADDTVRKSYVQPGTGDLRSDVEFFLQGVGKKIPGVRNTMQPTIDVWGNEKSNGSFENRLFQSFLSPGTMRTVDNSAVNEEIRRLAESTGMSSVYPSVADKYFTVDGERINLTAEKYTEFAKILGKTRYNAISDAIQSPYYSRLSDQQKADVISQIYEYANGVAKQSVSSYEPSKWILNAKKAEASGIPAGTYIYYKNRLSDLKESMNTSDANAALREELFQDSRLSAAKKTELDNYLITDGFYIPKDVNVDYSNDESFKITQMSDGAQKRWDSIKSRFGLDADAYAQAWDIYHTDGIKADEKRAQLQNIVGSDAAALYKAFGEKLK